MLIFSKKINMINFIKNKKLIALIGTSLAMISLTGCATQESNSKTATIDYQLVIKNHPQMSKAQDEMKVEYSKIQEDAKSMESLSPQEKQLKMINSQKMIQTKESSIFKPIKEDVDNAVNNVMKEKGIDIILDKRAVIAGGTDITSDVLIKEGVTPDKAKEIIEENKKNQMY